MDYGFAVWPKGSPAESRGKEGRFVVASTVELFKKWCGEFIKGCHPLLKWAVWKAVHLGRPKSRGGVRCLHLALLSAVWRERNIGEMLSLPSSLSL